MRDFYQIFVHVAYGCGSVLLWQGDEITRGRGSFLPTDNALYSIAFGTHTKRLNRSRCFRDDEWTWPEKKCVTWGDDLRRGMSNFGENMCPTSLSPLMNCKLDWSVQRRSHDRGRAFVVEARFPCFSGLKRSRIPLDF